MRKIQVPAVGGIRKMVTLPQQDLATTIGGFAGQTLSIAQLKTLLGVAAPPPGNGNIGPPGQGTPPPTPGSNAPHPIFMFNDDGDGGDSTPIPGRDGIVGTNGATGSAGPAGPATYLEAEPGEDGWGAIPGNPGVAGTNGATGAAGPVGPALFFLHDDGEDGEKGPPGAAGPPGNTLTALGARVSLQGNQSIPDSTTTAISWDTLQFDTGSFWNAGTPTVLTVPSTGLYMVSASSNWGLATTGQRFIAFRVNSGTVLIGIECSSVNNVGANACICVSTLLSLTAGDTVNVAVWQNSGGALSLSPTVLSASDQTNTFSIAKVH